MTEFKCIYFNYELYALLLGYKFEWIYYLFVHIKYNVICYIGKKCFTIKFKLDFINIISHILLMR